MSVEFWKSASLQNIFNKKDENCGKLWFFFCITKTVIALQ